MDSDNTITPQGGANVQITPNMTPVPSPQEQTGVASGGQSQPLQADGDDGKNKKNKKKVAVFVGLGVGVVAILIVLAILLPKVLFSNPVAGEWDCYKFSWSDDVTDEPVNKLILNTDGSFMYGSYDDIANNHFAGDTYKYSAEDKNSVDGYTYYMVEFGPTTEYIMNGDKQDTTGRQISDLEMAIGIENGKKEAVVIFEDSYSMYRCVAK